MFLKARYVGKKKEDFLVKDNAMDLTPGKEYEVRQSKRIASFFCVKDDSGEEYGYPKELFEIVEK